MLTLAKFWKAHAKALTAFALAEAGSLLTVLQDPHPSARMLAIAFLSPIVVGGATHQVSNQAAALNQAPPNAPTP